MLLKREHVLNVQDIKTQDVEVEEWGGAVRVRQMTLAERGEFARRGADSNSLTTTGAWLLSILCVDEKGARMFTDDDVEALQSRNSRAVDKVVDAILQINGLDQKKVDAAVKN